MVRDMFTKALLGQGEYKFCNSSIQLIDNEIFLLAVFQFEQEKVKIDPDKEIICQLSPDVPITIRGEKGRKDFYIGTLEDFIVRRAAIQGARQRMQKSLKYIRGGRGREFKLEPLEKLNKAERNFVKDRLHNYSRRLVDYAVKKGAGKIILDGNVYAKEAIKNKDNEILLKNWSFCGLSNFIKYKALKYGIEVEER